MNDNSFTEIFNKNPRRRAWWIFAVIMALTLIAGLISGGNYYNKLSDYLAGKSGQLVVLPKVKEVPFRLGLDLLGGSQLVYQADISKVAPADRDDAVAGVRDVIERRINVFGVSEPVVQINKTFNGDYRIIAELAGIKDVKEAIKMIGETPLLEFKEKTATSTASTLSADDQKKLDSYNKDLNTRATKALADIRSGKDFTEVAKANNLPKVLDGQTPTADNGDLGFISELDHKDIVAFVKNLTKGQYYNQLVKIGNGQALLKLEDKRFSAEKNTAEYQVQEIAFMPMTAADFNGNTDNWVNTKLTGKNLKSAKVEFNSSDGAPQVSLTFDTEGSNLFAEITGRNIGKQVAIYLDGYPISVPTVNEKITGGNAVISGSFSVTEAKLLAQRLNTGALPVPINLVSQQTVGASLGQASVNSSVFAGLIGLLIVALFMIAVYRLPGLLAVGALIIYGALSLAIFKLWPVTLTLSGIAGFILSIGMAVDANILIFERTKEEIKNGKALNLAITDGFNRAWPSIRDSNFTTIIVCLVLITFSTSVVKGFAVTLFLGVLISMFTAIFVTRNFLKLIGDKWLSKYHWLVTSAKRSAAETENK